SSGLFELVPDLYRPEGAHYRHRNCYAKRAAPALPIRFLSACSRGHLDDLPWVDYAHRGQPCASPELKFLEQGSGDEPSALAALSALTLPKHGDRLAQLVEEHWALLGKAQSAVFITAFRAAGQLNAFIRYTDEQVWKAVEARGAGGSPEAGDLKIPEYDALTD